MSVRPSSPPQDLGELLQASPYSYRVHKIIGAKMPSFLKLELNVALVNQTRPGISFANITCINAVDYAVRPKPSHCLLGGQLVCYYKKHARLETIGQDIPHSDGLEFFDPPIQFTLLELEDTYVIAERFMISFER